MKIKRKFLIPIFALVILAIVAIADIPPPPVNQNFGIYDTTIMNPADPTGQTPIYNETMCRGCHNSTSSPLVTGGVPTRHHTLVATSAINPSTNLPFVCTNCHPSTPGTGNGILIDRNCLNCHNASAFWGDSLGARVSNFTRPHHNTTHAQQRNCKFCHGASVDDYNDGHYVPPYPPSEVTPSALYGGGLGPGPQAFNSTSGRIWGGCLACHAEDKTKTPQIFFTHTNPSQIGGKFSAAPIADGTNNVHHNEILGITQLPGFSINDSKGLQCTWCHVDVVNVLNIRGCETCHSVRSIHNIQFDFTNTSTLRGFGHIGSNNPSDPANNSKDCLGCHAWYNAGDVNPFAGSIIPDVQKATPSVFNANTPTVVTLTGTNFVQANSTTVVNIDDTTNLTPTTLTNGQITVTVNLAAGARYIKVVKTDSVENVPKSSDIKPLTVVSKVTISSARLRYGVITISGSGFGTMPKTNAQQYVTIKHAGNVYYSDSINSWKGSQITAKKTSTPAAAKGDIVTVMTTNSGESSATIT
jgi:hypothetical protein